MISRQLNLISFRIGQIILNHRRENRDTIDLPYYITNLKTGGVSGRISLHHPGYHLASGSNADPGITGPEKFLRSDPGVYSLFTPGDSHADLPPGFCPHNLIKEVFPIISLDTIHRYNPISRNNTRGSGR